MLYSRLHKLTVVACWGGDWGEDVAEDEDVGDEKEGGEDEDVVARRF